MLLWAGTFLVFAQWRFFSFNDPFLSRIQSRVSHYIKNPCFLKQGMSLQRRGWEDCNNQWTRELALRYVSEHELDKAANSKHVKVNQGRATRPQPYPKNYRQLGHAESWRNSHPQRRAHQMVNLGDVYTRNTIQTEQVIFRKNIYAYTHIHAIATN